MPRTRLPVTMKSPCTRAFSLLELLVVVAIIVLLIAILVPALTAVRVAARKTQSQAISTQLLNAMSQFRKDTRRLPGYFTTAEMASSDNWSGVMAGEGERGFTETENVLLELLDAVIPESESPSFQVDEFKRVYTEIGPGGDAQDVAVDLQLAVQQSRGAYIRFDGSVLQQVTGQTTGPGTGETNPEYLQNLPSNFLDVVDPFGMPLLVWKRNVAATRNLPNYSLTEINYQEGATDNAAFYWATNAGYLGSSRLGARQVNQRHEGTNPTASLLGAGTLATTSNLRLSLAAVTASPGFPATSGSMEDALVGVTNASDFALPGAFRGDVVIHSAGPDRSYFRKRQDPSNDDVVGYLRYETSSAQPGPQPGTSEVDRFDDILTSGD